MSAVRTAVVLVDMQERFVGALVSKEYDRIVAAQTQLLQICRRKKIPVVVLEFERYGETIPELQAELAKLPLVLTLRKEVNDGFETRLHELMRGLDITQLIVTGINASYCVLETAESAVRLGYRIVTADNLVADAPKDYHRRKSRDWWKKNGIFSEGSLAFK